MTFLAISTRRIVGRGAGRRFEAEPGPATYLAAPRGAPAFHPDHKLSGAAEWAELVLGQLPKDGESRPSGDLVFLVHGFNVDEKDAFNFHRTVSENLDAVGFRHVLVSFDWPARGTITNYLEDNHDALVAAPNLVTGGIALFARFTRPDCRTRVHVVAHSMGAYVTREAFRQAEGHPPASQRAWGVSQMVLVAADISAGSLSNMMSFSMRQKAQRVTNYYSKFDVALATSNVKRFASSPRAGRHGAPEEMLGDIADVDCSDRWLALKESLPGGFDKIGQTHTWYFQDKQVFYKDLAATLSGEIDRTRIPTREPQAGGAGRLRLKPK